LGLWVWSRAIKNIGKFLSFIPPPLVLGTITLEDGTTVKDFICEHRVVDEGKDISHFSGWKSFRNDLN
jgi:allophanate hydrolase